MGGFQDEWIEPGVAVDARKVKMMRLALGGPAEGWNPRPDVTLFRSKVLALCAQVPPGQVTTYKAIATALGSAPRAVGGALKRNPYAPLPVPCHRVVAASLGIGGFAGLGCPDPTQACYSAG